MLELDNKPDMLELDNNLILNNANENIEEDPPCNYIIPDVSKLDSCILNNINCNHKVDFNKNVAIVDFSYFVYCRFFAIRSWYCKAYSEKAIPDNYDWTNDIIFMEKFTQLFMKKLYLLCKKKDIPYENIIYILDCKHSNNWRVIKDTEYKGTRLESHKRNKFNNFNIFDFVKKTILVEQQKRYGNLVFYHKHLEADDLVAILCNYLSSNKTVLKFNGSISIIASDKDYIQLCQNNINLYDLNGKAISDNILGNHLSCQDYLIIKILIGDPSDNIPCCYIGNEFVKKCGINPARTKTYVKATFKMVEHILLTPYGKSNLYNYLMFCRQNNMANMANTFINITKDNQFITNAKIIDFQNIPDNYFTDVYNMYISNFGS